MPILNAAPSDDGLPRTRGTTPELVLVKPNAGAEHGEGNDAGSRSPEDVSVKRLNVNLPVLVWQELTQLCVRTGKNMTEIVRLGLSLVALAINEKAAGNKLAVTTPDGTVIKEVVLPL